MEKGKPYSVEKIVADLKQVIKELESHTFEGVLLYANHKKNTAWTRMIKGDAQDRLAMVDAALMSMQHEPSQEARDWFFNQIYERFKTVRPPPSREADMAIA